MKDKILKELKTKYSHLGFSAEVLENVATLLGTYVTEDDKIANAVSGAEPMLKSFQSNADGRVATFKNESAKHKSQAEELAGKLAKIEAEKGNQGGNKSGEDTPEYVKSIMDTMQTLTKEITTLKTEKISTSLKSQFVAKMNDLKIPESYYETALAGREFSDNEQVNELIEIVKSSHEKHNQYVTETVFKGVKPPETGGDPKTEEEELKGLVEEVLTEEESKN